MHPHFDANPRGPATFQVKRSEKAHEAAFHDCRQRFARF
jgi:hypothetical protein